MNRTIGIDETPVRPGGASRDLAIILSLTRDIKGDQEMFKRDVSGALKNIDNAIIQQNSELKNQTKEIGQLTRSVADLSVRTSKLELETQKHEIRLQQIEDCKDEENTEVKNLRQDFTNLIRTSSQEQIQDLKTEVARLRSRHSKTPPHGSQLPVGGWWSSPAGKSVLAALAGFLMAATSAITWWVAQPQVKAERIEHVEPDRPRSIHKLPKRYEQKLLDEIEKSRDGQGESDETIPL